ncbi:MAG TPA: asparagine synthase (glutamine-hydrolyzing) [Methanoregulaceae archaeon]|nr:asparagine synthase (glutamine-hydrolyzing) [Methanoregulaceae archaeon]
MCGISALVLFKEDSDQYLFIHPMNDNIRHRGPDDEGFALFCDDNEVILRGGKDTPDNVLVSSFPYAPSHRKASLGENQVCVALGHRRLSILDLSPAGHQPMCTPDRRFWIVYNGEVYNYRELRTELEAAGHTFHTGTDTEVILRAYAEWGRDCLNRFNGMFAFVLYDRDARTIFAARDRFGVKPLYYWFSPEGFLAFASEIKQFTVLPGWRARLNHQRAFDFLAYSLLDHTNETMFAGVRQLRGGEAVEIGIDAIEDRLPVFRWYEFRPNESQLSYEDACKTFRELFTDSVRLRLRADVPIGSCLSGGLDSSAIVCVVNDLLKAEAKGEVQRTFSATSDVKRFDESDFIRAVVDERGIEGHYVCPSMDFLITDLDRIIWHQDEPFGSSSIYAQWSVFRLAAEHGMKVMLDGQGADEQLCGYHTFFPARYADLFLNGRWLQLVHEMKLAQKNYGYPIKQSAIEMAFFALPDVVRRPIQRVLFSHLLAPVWINTDKLKAPLRINNFLPQSHGAFDLSFSQIFYSSLPMLLHWEDRNSMAHSIESRVPFLDYRLVEFVVGLPGEQKLANCRTKQVLRDGLNGILPEQIRERRDKIGFATAEVEWIRNQDPALFRSMVISAIQRSQGILNDEARKQLEEVIRGERDYTTDYFIWRWICFARWLNLFDVALD